MKIQLLWSDKWQDYALLDSGEGERLERYGQYVVRRPDPQVLWEKSDLELWSKVDAVYKDEEWLVPGGQLLDRWEVRYGALKFWAKLTPFKHTGIFPEQAVHWEWMRERINPSVRVLNLFGYTGAASVVCAKAGAKVTHVDASKPALSWAKENMLLSGLDEDSIRWILEDVLSFVKREVRRGNKYDAIIMDPPVFGHGVKGEVWKFQEHFPELLGLCMKLLSETPVFMIVNAYAISASALMLNNVLVDYVQGEVDCGELVLREKYAERYLSTGIFGRVSF